MNDGRPTDAVLRDILGNLKELTDAGLTWEYRPLRPLGAWGNPHAMQHRARLGNMDAYLDVYLTRKCIGSDVPKDGISLCVRIGHNGVAHHLSADFAPEGAGWAEATALWQSVHDEVDARPVWKVVAEKIAEVARKAEV